MLTTFSLVVAQETMRGLAARGRPRRGESAAKPTAPGAPYGAWGHRRRPPVGFGVRFRIALAIRTLRVRAGWGHMLTTFRRGQMPTTRHRV